MFKILNLNLNSQNSLEEFPGELVEDPVEESVKDSIVTYICL